MPNRIIKESICRSDSIDSLSWFEEVLFYRLIVVCDDYGRFDGRPAVVKGSCFPLKDDITKKQIDDALKKLSTVGLVRGYEVRGKSFLQLTAWEKHQQIRAKNSKYPAPETECNHMISDDIKCPRESRIDIRESIYENQESNAGARAKTAIERFEYFWCCYPLDKNRYLAEQAYIGVIMDGIYTEDDLVESAKNYAEYCKITGIDKIYHADNFLKKCVFEDYLPGKYKKPAQQNPKNIFNDFPQRDYDFDELERQLLANNPGGG